MIEAKALLFFAGVIALCMLALIVDWICRRWALARERRAMRVRDQDLWDLISPYEPSAREKQL